MTFNEWWDMLTKGEKKVLGEGNAKFVWEECQKYTLMTIEEACKAQTAYEQGFKDGQARFEVHVGGYTLTPGAMPDRIWISSPRGEGGDFLLHELAEVIDKFFAEKF
jgi:hypothetical protein